jgi:hypothetical protein
LKFRTGACRIPRPRANLPVPPLRDRTCEADDDRRERLAGAGIIRTGSGKLAAVLRGRPLDMGVSRSDAVQAERAGPVVGVE